jgi:hypothetical protein
MALSFVAQSTASPPGGSADTVVSRPSGVVSGDLMVALIYQHGNISGGRTIPAGWTAGPSDESISVYKVFTYWKVATGSEPASYTWNFGTGSLPYITILAYRGAASGLNAGAATASASAPPAAPSITTTLPGCVLACIWGTNSSGSFTTPGGMTQQATTVRSLVATESRPAAGATGTRTANGGSSISFAAASVGIAPANQAPNAPILTSPVGGATVDRTATINLQGTFSDPDAGDQLSQVTVEYRPVGGSTTTVVQSASGSSFTVAITAGTLAAGNYEWRAKTKDNATAEGPFSAWAPFTAASPPTAPVLTQPANAATIASNPSTTEWTAPAQDAFQVQTRSASGGGGTLHHDSGTVEQAATRTYSTPRPVTGRTEWTRVRVRVSGLWSTWTERSNTVAYTPPPTPTCTVASNVDDEPAVGDPAGFIVIVDVTNPAPSGGQPTVTRNEIDRQQSSDGGTTWTDSTGTTDAYDTIAVDVAANGSHPDYTVADQSRAIYRYRVRAVGDNTTTTTGAWTS